MPVPFSTLFNIEQPRSEIGVELRLINKDDLSSAPQTASTSTPRKLGKSSEAHALSLFHYSRVACLYASRLHKCRGGAYGPIKWRLAKLAVRSLPQGGCIALELRLIKNAKECTMKKDNKPPSGAEREFDEEEEIPDQDFSLFSTTAQCVSTAVRGRTGTR